MLDLDRVLIRDEVDDLEGMAHNVDSEQLFASVPAGKHEGSHQTLHDRARRLAESATLVTLGSVRQVHSKLRFHSNVVFQRNVIDRDIIIGPACDEIVDMCKKKCWLVGGYVQVGGNYSSNKKKGENMAEVQKNNKK